MKLAACVWTTLPDSPYPTIAFMQVEEISAAQNDKKTVAKETSDPLEQFCEGNPDADECRVYGELRGWVPSNRPCRAAIHQGQERTLPSDVWLCSCRGIKQWHGDTSSS